MLSIRLTDILFYIQERTELTRLTILEILKNSDRISDVLINPQFFLDNTIIAIKEVRIVVEHCIMLRSR
ncbi:hypothetical protein KAR48_20795 [bacterium]|nr:hypothetical protein [bacterium]